MAIRQVFVNKAEKKTWRRLDDTHVIGTPSGRIIERDDAYFVLRLTEMYLENTRKLWRKFYPMLHGFVEYRGAEEHSVAGPGQLKALGNANLDRIANFNYALAGPTPYSHEEDVDLIVGLYAIPGGDAARVLLDTVSTIAGIGDIALGVSTELAEAVKSGVENILGLDMAALQLGVRDSFIPGTQPLRAGFHVAIDAPEQHIDLTRLWLNNGRLVKGTHPEVATPYDDHDYMVLAVERRETRDDWPRLPAIGDFDETFAGIITGSDSLERKKEQLRELWPSFADQVHTSGHLITRDKKQILANVKADLQERMKRPGLDFESLGAAPQFGFLDVVQRMDFSDRAVADRAMEELTGNPFVD